MRSQASIATSPFAHADCATLKLTVDSGVCVCICAAHEAGRFAAELALVFKQHQSGTKPHAHVHAHSAKKGAGGSDAQKQEEGELLLAVDEHPRPDVPLEKMAKLPAVFRKERGRVTAATASVRRPSHPNSIAPVCFANTASLVILIIVCHLAESQLEPNIDRT